MRILLSRGIGGIDERTRGLTQRWFDMVDWRSAHVGIARLGISRIIEGYTRKLEGEVSRQARAWLEQQEKNLWRMSSSKGRPPASAGITRCRWSRNCSRERMQHLKRLDGKQLIPADTRNTCVGA
jgi:hypothetical protein